MSTSRSHGSFGLHRGSGALSSRSCWCAKIAKGRLTMMTMIGQVLPGRFNGLSMTSDRPGDSSHDRHVLPRRLNELSMSERPP